MPIPIFLLAVGFKSPPMPLVHELLSPPSKSSLSHTWKLSFFSLLSSPLLSSLLLSSSLLFSLTQLESILCFLLRTQQVFKKLDPPRNLKYYFNFKVYILSRICRVPFAMKSYILTDSGGLEHEHLCGGAGGILLSICLSIIYSITFT